jgi:osmotically-inducible protein OsmY
MAPMFDQALQRRIVAALDANPRVDDDEIAVESFDGGHVVLRGRAESPDKSTQAVRTASGVPGVRTVDDQLNPRRRGASHRADARTEAAVLNALIADAALPAETMHVHVSDGTVTLSGRVDFPYQREEVEDVAMAVPGISETRNLLSVWVRVSVNEVTERVTKAIGEAGADQLTVSTHHNVVTLSGTVRCAADRDAAIAAAEAATAVVDVEDKIQVA